MSYKNDIDKTFSDIQAERNALLSALQEYKRSYLICQELRSLLDRWSEEVSKCEMAGRYDRGKGYCDCVHDLRRVMDGEKVKDL